MGVFGGRVADLPGAAARRIAQAATSAGEVSLLGQESATVTHYPLPLSSSTSSCSRLAAMRQALMLARDPQQSQGQGSAARAERCPQACCSCLPQLRLTLLPRGARLSIATLAARCSRLPALAQHSGCLHPGAPALQLAASVQRCSTGGGMVQLHPGPCCCRAPAMAWSTSETRRPSPVAESTAGSMRAQNRCW